MTHFNYQTPYYYCFETRIKETKEGSQKNRNENTFALAAISINRKKSELESIKAL